ncbi:MAG TPA: cytochrome d ubiquinol oxidase subunit II [Polyangiaceae bacterium]|jgi:cytochrome d ubiquinol oxidase subunit II|nr:cytochrome d ubiquinol oxidase subunit II [Polyangiaceae bacterium]
MEAVFYVVVAAMLSTWAVLDGFDFGVGVVHRVVARTEQERGRALAAIGPVWDGNEVWLVASGGVFLFAFPRAYAVALSGMYLTLVVVLWLLIFRGIAIELRAQIPHPLWRDAWDGMFAFSSTAMAFVAGVALGNVVRGVPIDETGWFQLDLFALRGERVAAIDGYTGLVGLLSVFSLGAHGATYLAWKTDGALHDRAVATAQRAWVITVALGLAATVTTGFVRPSLFAAFSQRWWVWPLPAIALCSPAVALRALARGQELRAFLASSALIASLLLATAGALYPVLLPSTVSRRFDLDTHAAASGEHGLALGLAWWLPAMALAVLYFVNLFRSMRGKVAADDPHGE